MHDEILTYAEAAELLGVPESTLRALVCRRRVPHIRLSNRLVRFDRGELKAWLQAHAVRPCAA